MEIEFQDIPKTVKNTYLISQKDYGISISEPAYVNVKNPVTIEENEYVYTFENDKVSVSIWKRVVAEHITVF